MEACATGYYGPDLSLVHHLGYGFSADAVAGDLLAMLEPVRRRGGVVLELGCGSGHLTRHLVAAGHRVIASDASPAMLALTREAVPGVVELRQIVLPDDPLPEADAVVSVGHVMSYLPDAGSITRALTRVARALAAGGLLALDLCDLRYGEARPRQPPYGRAEEDWAIITEYTAPAPDRYVRHITTFLRNGDGTWRRSDERHDNVLIDTSQVPRLLLPHGVQAAVAPTFGSTALPEGLVAVTGHRAA